MEIIKLNYNQETGDGVFELFENEIRYGRLEFILKDNVLTATHTIVEPEGQGKGYAGMLYDELMRYVAEKSLKIVAECSYIFRKLEKSEGKYDDIWIK